jgi:hypothetical protein
MPSVINHPDGAEKSGANYTSFHLKGQPIPLPQNDTGFARQKLSQMEKFFSFNRGLIPPVNPFHSHNQSF